jgi:hypothetical protein
MDKTIKIAVFTVIIILGLSTSYKMYMQSEKNLTVEVLMTSWQSGSIAMYVDTGEGFNEKLSVRRSYIGDGTSHKYSLPLQIFRDINALRLDPADAKGKIEISEITITWQGTIYRFAGKDLNQWQLKNGLVNKGDTANKGILLDATSSHPQMVITLSLPYSLIKEVFSFLRDKIALLIWLSLFMILGSREHSWTLSEEIKEKNLYFFISSPGEYPSFSCGYSTTRRWKRGGL